MKGDQLFNDANVETKEKLSPGCSSGRDTSAAEWRLFPLGNGEHPRATSEGRASHASVPQHTSTAAHSRSASFATQETPRSDHSSPRSSGVGLQMTPLQTLTPADGIPDHSIFGDMPGSASASEPEPNESEACQVCYQVKCQKRFQVKWQQKLN